MYTHMHVHNNTHMHTVASSVSQHLHLCLARDERCVGNEVCGYQALGNRIFHPEWDWLQPLLPPASNTSQTLSCCSPKKTYWCFYYASWSLSRRYHLLILYLASELLQIEDGMLNNFPAGYTKKSVCVHNTCIVILGLRTLIGTWRPCTWPVVYGFVMYSLRRVFCSPDLHYPS